MSRPKRLLRLVGGTLAVVSLHAAQPSRHVVMISIDGMRPAAYTKAGPAKIPAIRRLMQQGAWARGVTGVLPSVTYPSHTTLITGVLPARHGIYDNRVLDPENRSNMAWYWYARDIKVTTLPGAVRARGLTAAAVSWPVTVGMDLDYNVPEILRSRHRESLELLDALTWPRHLLDAYGRATGTPYAWPSTDADRGGVAAWIERTFQPNLLLLHIYDTDTTSHESGPDSPEAAAALERADAIVATMIAQVKAAGLESTTDVVVVSDHGFLPIRQQLQPNAAFKQAGLLQTDAKGTITRWEAYFHSSGGSGYVFLSRPGDTTLAQQVASLLQRLAAEPANGIEKIWSRADLDLAGAHPDASFGITMKAGWYSSGETSALLVPATSKGGHGFDPAVPELRASLVMAGPDVPAVGDLGIIAMTRIAPTVAGWLDVRLSPEAAEPLPLAAVPARK